MAGNPEMQQLNQTLKEMNRSLKAMTRILETTNSNLVALGKLLSQKPDEDSSLVLADDQPIIKE